MLNDTSTHSRGTHRKWISSKQLCEVTTMRKSTGPAITTFDSTHTMDKNSTVRCAAFALSVSGPKLHRRRVHQVFQKGTTAHCNCADFSRMDKDSAVHGKLSPSLKEACVAAHRKWLDGTLPKLQELKKERSSKGWKLDVPVDKKRLKKPPKRCSPEVGETNKKNKKLHKKNIKNNKNNRRRGKKAEERDEESDESSDDDKSSVGTARGSPPLPPPPLSPFHGHTPNAADDKNKTKKMRDLEEKCEQMRQQLAMVMRTKAGGCEAKADQKMRRSDDNASGASSEEVREPPRKKRRKKKRNKRSRTPPSSSGSSESSGSSSSESTPPPRKKRNKRDKRGKRERRNIRDGPSSSGSSSSDDDGVAKCFQMKCEHEVLRKVLFDSKKKAHRKGRRRRRRRGER